MRIATHSWFVAVLSAATGCAMFYSQPSTRLAQAAWKGDLTTVRALVAEGANINEQDAVGQTPLHLAAQGGHPLGPHRCGQEDENRPALVAAMIDLGADLNQRDRRPRTPGGSSGWTPLVLALHHQQFKTAAVLLERGADPDIRSDQGMSAMDMAVAEGAPEALMGLIRAKSKTQAAHK